MTKANRCTSVAVLRALIAATLVTLAPVQAQGQAIKLKPGPIPGRAVHTAKALNEAFCEIIPIVGKFPNITVEFYNTTGTTGPGSGCPADQFAAINVKTLASALKVDSVHMNPSPQTARRHWVMDENWVYKVGETVDFMGVKATWMASMSLEQMRGGVRSPYEGSQIQRATKYLYKKGSMVFLMRTPDNKTYVMQSYGNEVDKSLSIAQLPKLGGRLQLPAGWKFEARTLTKDLTVAPVNANGMAHIIRDDLQNVYEGCGFDRACNYIP